MCFFTLFFFLLLLGCSRFAIPVIFAILILFFPFSVTLSHFAILLMRFCCCFCFSSYTFVFISVTVLCYQFFLCVFLVCYICFATYNMGFFLLLLENEDCFSELNLFCYCYYAFVILPIVSSLAILLTLFSQLKLLS